MTGGLRSFGQTDPRRHDVTDWNAGIMAEFREMVKDAKSSGDAATILN